MPIKLKANNGNIDLKAPIKQIGGKVDSVNGMTGDVVLDIPSKTSDLVNDSGFLTEHQSLADYAKKSDIPDVSDYVTDTQLNTAISSAEERVDFKLGSYALKTEVPSVDGLASEQWVESKGYLTQHQSLADYALKSEIPTVPTNVSTFTNDSGYLTIATLPKYDGGVE